MTCEEAQALQGAYVDSELDAAITLRVAEHLKSCPECCRSFAEAQTFEMGLKAALREGERSVALWEATERAVLAAAHATPAAARTARNSQPLWPSLNWLRIVHPRIARGPARWIWAGLAAAWLVILFLNVAARDTTATPVAREMAPSSAVMRFALTQKQRLMAELSLASDNASPSKPAAGAPGPRSDRRQKSLNS